MSALEFLLLGSAIGISAAASPGPFQSLVIAQALAGGWRRAAPVTFGPLLADIPIAIVMVALVSQAPAEFLRFIMFAGAVLLLYLAWGLWKDLRKQHETGAIDLPAPQSPWRGLLQGTLMIFLSPGSYLFWAGVLGPKLVEGLAISPVHGLAFLFGFYLFSIGGLILLAIVLGHLGQMNARMRRGLQMGSLALLLIIAVLLIQSSIFA